jgi:hypothetical protein
LLVRGLRKHLFVDLIEGALSRPRGMPRVKSRDGKHGQTNKAQACAAQSQQMNRFTNKSRQLVFSEYSHVPVALHALYVKSR